MQALVDNGEPESALALFFREVVRMPEPQLAAYSQLPMWGTRIQLAPTVARELIFDRTYHFNAEKFASLQIPTMLLLGGDSPPLFRQAIELLDSALPHSHVVILPEQQHTAMDTAPDLFVQAVLPFILE